MNATFDATSNANSTATCQAAYPMGAQVTSPASNPLSRCRTGSKAVLAAVNLRWLRGAGLRPPLFDFCSTPLLPAPWLPSRHLVTTAFFTSRNPGVSRR